MKRSASGTAGRLAALIPAAALLCLAGLGVAVAADSGPRNTVDPNSPYAAPKQSAIDAASPPSPEELQRIADKQADLAASASADADERWRDRQQQDSTSGDRRSELQAAVVDLIERNYLLQAAPAGTAARIQALEAPGKRDQVQREAAAIWKPSKVAARVDNVMGTLKAQADSPPMWSFTDTRLTVHEWGDIAAGKTSASAVFTGQFADLIAGNGNVVSPHWEDEPESIWHVALSMSRDGHWQLSSFEVHHADGGQG